MKTIRKLVDALNKAIGFVDIFGDNLGGTKLSDCVKLSINGKKLTIQSSGNVKSFEFGEYTTHQIYEEVLVSVNDAIKGFKSNYPGYVSIHQGKFGDKMITTLSSQIALDGRLSKREKMAVIIREGKKVSCRYEITETFTEFF